MARQIDFRAPRSRTPPRPSTRRSSTPITCAHGCNTWVGRARRCSSTTPTPAGARYRLRHGLDKSMLPPLVQTLVSGNLVLERTETIQPAGPSRYDGTVDVQIPGRR